MTQLKNADQLVTKIAVSTTHEEMTELLMQSLELIRFLEAQHAFQSIRLKSLTERNARQTKMLEAFV